MAPPVPPEPIGISDAEITKQLVQIEAFAEMQTPPVTGARLAAILANARAKLLGGP